MLVRIAEINFSYVPCCWKESREDLPPRVSFSRGGKSLQVIQDRGVRFRWWEGPEGLDRSFLEVFYPSLDEGQLKRCIGEFLGLDGAEESSLGTVPRFEPRWGPISSDLLLDSALEMERHGEVFVTYHPALLYSWVRGEEYRTGYESAEAALSQVPLIPPDPDFRVFSGQKESEEISLPILLDGMVQYLAYLDTRNREDRDEAYPERVHEIHGLLSEGPIARVAYRWMPIPVWDIPSSPVRGAVLQHRALRIRYTNMGDGLTHVRMVEPHYVFDARTTGNRVLLTWCRLRGNWRCFILNRIEVLRIGRPFSFQEREVRAHLLRGIQGATETVRKGPLDVETLNRLSREVPE